MHLPNLAVFFSCQMVQTYIYQTDNSVRLKGIDALDCLRWVSSYEPLGECFEIATVICDLTCE